ncbi:MAG TPA: choice-of-anchor L domain-containing protein [Nannocystaceae bacterium]|nr:choice-of-anchor L domain-containing protein [Nannocystaceae bacterium]
MQPGSRCSSSLVLVAVLAGCPSASPSDIDFTGGSSDTSSAATTTSGVLDTSSSEGGEESSTAATGCSADEDCASDPAGPHCDPITHTCGGECVPGDTRACYSGPPNTEGMGACVAGVQTCGDDGTFALWCEGEVVPDSNDCDSDGVDDDCDGNVDDTDLDGDGFGGCSVDCCDVDGGGCEGAALVNPGAFEVGGNEVDDDCDGDIDEAEPGCDAGLASASGDGLDYARALELCSFTTEDPVDPAMRTWGVIDASFSHADGTGSPLAVQRSLRADFGNLIDPKAGDRMAVLSSGHAADATDVNPGFAAFQAGENLGTNSGAPADWLAANGGAFPNPAGCPEPWDVDAHDPIMLTLRIRVPTNAQSFSVKMFFLSAEYPEWACSEFNDFFVALVDSTADNPADKNIAIYEDDDDTAWPVGVNLVISADGLFTQCENGDVGCASDLSSSYDGCVGNALLAGTGFDAADDGCGAPQTQVGGGTGWLRMSGNVTPGEVMELRVAIWDTSGHIFDSLVLLDDWEWSLQGAMPGVAPG